MMATAEKAAAAREEFYGWLSGQEPEPCEIHGDAREIDGDASWKATRDRNYEEYRIIHTPCPTCEAEIGDQQAVNRLRRVHVPEDYLHYTFETFPHSSPEDRGNMTVCQQWARDKVGFLILRGNVGCGKTGLAVSILRANGGYGHYITHQGMLDLRRKGYNDAKAAARVERIRNSCLLIFDELGLSVGGGDDLMMVHDLIDHRLSAMLPTVFTTNCTTEELIERIGDRAYDRLKQGVFKVLGFTGESKRKSENNEFLERWKQKKSQQS